METDEVIVFGNSSMVPSDRRKPWRFWRGLCAGWYFYRSLWFKTTKKFDRSLTYGIRAPEYNPRGPIEFLIVTPLLFERGRFQEARLLLERGLSIQPNDPTMNRFMIDAILSGGGTIEEALPYLEAYWPNRFAPHRKSQRYLTMIQFGRRAFGKSFDRAAAEQKENRAYDAQVNWHQWARGVLEFYERPTD